MKEKTTHTQRGAGGGPEGGLQSVSRFVFDIGSRASGYRVSTLINCRFIASKSDGGPFSQTLVTLLWTLPLPNSVTRRLDYSFNFCPLQQLIFAQQLKKFPKEHPEFCQLHNEPSLNCQRLIIIFRQSGEISPNLVTLLSNYDYPRKRKNERRVLVLAKILISQVPLNRRSGKAIPLYQIFLYFRFNLLNFSKYPTTHDSILLSAHNSCC